MNPLKWIFPLVLLCSAFTVKGERVITIEESRALALENNRDLKISAQHYDAAQSLRRASRSKFLPSFDFSAQYIRMNKPFNLLSQSLFLPVVPFGAINPETGNLKPLELLQSDPPVLVFGPDGMPVRDADGNFIFRQYAYLPKSETEIGRHNNLLANFSLMQPIYTGGKIRAQYRAAGHMEQIAQYGRKLSEAEVLLEVESFFWQLITVQQKQKLAKQYMEMLESLIHDMEGYLEEGIVNRNDLLKARVALNEAEMELLKAENGIMQLSMALCRLTGLPLTQRLLAQDELQGLARDYVLDDLWSEGLGQRPEIFMVKEKAGLAGSMADLAGAARYPDLALGASYFAINPNPYNGLEKEFGHDWFVGLTLTVPVFHWGEKRQIYRAALHEKNVQQLKLEDIYELIKMDITRAYLDLTESKMNVKIKTLSLEQATENLSIARDGFGVGALKTTEMLEAQTLWHQAQTDLIESQALLRTSYAQLEKAIGK